MCLPALNNIDYASQKGIDFPQFFSTHLQTKDYVDSDGSILPSLVALLWVDRRVRLFVSALQLSSLSSNLVAYAFSG